MNTPTCCYYLYNYINCAWCPQTSAVGSRSTFPALMLLHAHLSACLWLLFSCYIPLEGPLLGTSEDFKPLQCSRYCSVKKLGVHQTPHEVVISFHSPQPSDQLLSYTHCRHCCTLSLGRWEGEGVYRTVNTVIVSFQTVSTCIVDVHYTCSWGCGMPLPIA